MGWQLLETDPKHSRTESHSCLSQVVLSPGAQHTASGASILSDGGGPVSLDTRCLPAS